MTQDRISEYAGQSGTQNNPLNADEAERAVLSGMLKGIDEADDGRELICGEDFRNHHHRAIFDTIDKLRIADRSAAPDAVFLAMKKANTSAELGDNPARFLADLYEEVPTAANLSHAAEQVRDAADRRFFKDQSAEANRDMRDNVEPATETIDRFEQTLRTRTERRQSDQQDSHIAALAASGLARLNAITRGEGPSVFAGTGSPRLDSGYGGFSAGQLTILAARPSKGKSAMALRFAEAAYTQGVGVAMFSLEMSQAELMDRLIASTTGVPLSKVRGVCGKPSDEEAGRIAAEWGTRSLEDLPFWINDRSNLTASHIALRARRLARRKGVKIVIVDYLQLLRAENPKDPRHLQVGASCKRLKQLAKEAGVAVVCLAQLNRESVNRADPTPRLSDLRDSGEIEQDADVVMLLHSSDENPELDVQPVDLILAKNRNGPTGVFPFEYRRAITRFDERFPTL